MKSLTTISEFAEEILQQTLPGHPAIPCVVLWGSSGDLNTSKLILLLDLWGSAHFKQFYVEIESCMDLSFKYSVRQCPLLMVFQDGLLVAKDSEFSPAIRHALGV